MEPAHTCVILCSEFGTPGLKGLNSSKLQQPKAHSHLRHFLSQLCIVDSLSVRAYFTRVCNKEMKARTLGNLGPKDEGIVRTMSEDDGVSWSASFSVSWSASFSERECNQSLRLWNRLLFCCPLNYLLRLVWIARYLGHYPKFIWPKILKWQIVDGVQVKFDLRFRKRKRINTSLKKLHLIYQFLFNVRHASVSFIWDLV